MFINGVLTARFEIIDSKIDAKVMVCVIGGVSHVYYILAKYCEMKTIYLFSSLALVLDQVARIVCNTTFQTPYVYVASIALFSFCC